jgi:hypothetical protein
MTVIKQGARRVAFCTACRRDSQQQLTATTPVTGTVKPDAENWRCLCGREMLTLADVTDALRLCEHVLWEHRERRLGPKGAHLAVQDGGLDYQDALLHLHAEVWAAYLRWNPAQARFLPYATTMLRYGFGQWLRRNYRDDRNGTVRTQAASIPLSAFERELGADALERTLGSGAVDADPDSLARLRRELDRRRGALARLDDEASERAAARPAGRAAAVV